jgi:mycothiol synthase
MKLTMRGYQQEDDYWRIREFLRAAYLAVEHKETIWEIARLDYWRWHLIDNCQMCESVEKGAFIWETDTGQIGAVLNVEDMGKAWLQVHPDFREPGLEEAMIETAEAHLTTVGADGKRKLTVWASARDTQRQDILTRQGYTKGQWPEHVHIRQLNGPVAAVPPPAGYTVRALGDLDELPARSWASWRGFHPDEPDEDYEGWEWYHHIQRMPLYRRDLDIVAATPDGEIASFCTLWYDDAIRAGYFEPIATVPEHLRRGLGKAVMSEALRRIQRLGATTVTVGGYSDAANALYDSVVSPQVILI